VLNADHGLTINKHTGVAHYPDGSPVLYHGAPAALATEEGEIYDNLELVKEDPKKFQEQVYNHVSKDVKEGRGIQKGFFATTDPLNALNYARPWNNSRSGVQKFGICWCLVLGQSCDNCGHSSDEARNGE
jgi:hypothetical protein